MHTLTTKHSKSVEFCNWTICNETCVNFLYFQDYLPAIEDGHALNLWQKIQSVKRYKS